MNKLIPFEFSGRQIRVIQIDGEPFFVGKDVAAILGYADSTTALRSHCRGVQILHPITDALGRTQDMRVLSEADMMRLVVNSTLPAADAFERWVFEEVLTSIRKTGGYQMPAAPRQPSKIDVELAGAEAFARMLKPAPSSQVAMLTHIIKSNGGDPGFLPAYVVDAATDTPGSSMVTKPLTALLRDHGIRIGVRAYNLLLGEAGYLVEMKRKSNSPRAADGIKHFWAITDAGLQYGKNLTNPGNPRETQPHWYVERFAEMHAQVAARLECADAN
jgi:prophage antirepressor-like protein